jgi:peptidoglycan LD-endopeptidase CwlK
MTARDHDRLLGVHPDLIARITRILDEMAALGHPMFVVMGVRTVAQQQALYAQGRSAPGHVVTMKDGVRHRSNHQPHADGLGHAVDCAFLNPDPFGSSQPWETYGQKVEAAGLTWGGRWKMVDCPHAELS